MTPPPPPIPTLLCWANAQNNSLNKLGSGFTWRSWVWADTAWQDWDSKDYSSSANGFSHVEQHPLIYSTFNRRTDDPSFQPPVWRPKWFGLEWRWWLGTPADLRRAPWVLHPQELRFRSAIRDGSHADICQCVWGGGGRPFLFPPLVVMSRERSSSLWGTYAILVELSQSLSYGSPSSQKLV